MAQIPASATKVTLFARNPNALQRTCHNDSTAILYLKYGDDAASTDYSYRLAAQMTWEAPRMADGTIYTGLITGIWSSVDGNAYVTETGKNPAIDR